MNPFQTSREIPATPAQIFAAIRSPERLAKWWGPEGFTNTFELCEFKPSGRWVFTMHGPDGANYPNENVFAEIQDDSKVVIDHIPFPQFRLTITLTASGEGTLVSWHQLLADSEFAAKVAHIIVPANEQNLDRLAAEVLKAI
ncbi:MAG: polyketide cyclase [Burkholderiales bacterium]|nr:MAG: polyketide cyclase [Burkholderiales bacterium]